MSAIKSLLLELFNQTAHPVFITYKGVEQIKAYGLDAKKLKKIGKMEVFPGTDLAKAAAKKYATERGFWKKEKEGVVCFEDKAIEAYLINEDVPLYIPPHLQKVCKFMEMSERTRKQVVAHG